MTSHGGENWCALTTFHWLLDSVEGAYLWTTVESTNFVVAT